MEIKKLCPYCGIHGLTPDVSGHLYINTVKKLYFCHRCGAKGEWDGGALPVDIWIPKKEPYANVELFPFPPGLVKRRVRL